jgi:hypothetical protein
MSLQRHSTGASPNTQNKRFVSHQNAVFSVFDEITCYTLRKIPPYFKRITSARSKLLAPAVCTNKETKKHTLRACRLSQNCTPVALTRCLAVYRPGNYNCTLGFSGPDQKMVPVELRRQPISSSDPLNDGASI